MNKPLSLALFGVGCAGALASQRSGYAMPPLVALSVAGKMTWLLVAGAVAVLTVQALPARLQYQPKP